MKVRIIEGLEGLRALAESWERLETQALLPMQQFIWAKVCAAVFASQGELRCLVVEEGGDVVAIAPLLRPKGSPYYEWLGTAQLFEPSDVLCFHPQALETLATALAGLGVPLLFKRLPADSRLVTALSQAYRRRGLFFVRPDGPWPWITLDSGWKEPESKFNSKRRAYLKRARRLANELGAVAYEALTPSPENLSPLLEEALAVEAASWKGKTGTALALDPVIGTFYRRYAEAACAKGILRLCFLRIAGRAAAMQIGVETGGRFWLLKIGYDETYAACSPGNLLIRETVSDAAGRGLKSIAFLGAMESWKKQWTGEENPCVILRGYPWNWRGMTRLAGDGLHSGWARLTRLF